MSAALRVIQPGLLTTVQDLGRIGYQRQGIPVSGALDPLALRAANVVVGNEQSAAGLEMAIMGPTLEVAADSARIAIAGLDASLEITPEAGDKRAVPSLQSTRVVRGDRIKVVVPTASAVAYLVVEGGFGIAPFLGSLSTYVRGGFGGLNGRTLQAGDDLPLAAPEAGERTEMRLKGFDLAPATRVRIVPGPQDDYFTPEAMAAFLGQPYTVTREADRMGLRLAGPVLAHAKGYNIVSDGIAPGAIQVPGSGLPIVLLADRQTTGGYPKIATVISSDLPALGRVLPGMSICFELVSLDEAEAARRTLEAEMSALVDNLEPVRADGPDLERLYDTNLVSGVVCAREPRVHHDE